jgi:hypothetical protein
MATRELHEEDQPEASEGPGAIPTKSILAFQPECNPSAHTTPASRRPVGRAGERDEADPAELDTHRKAFPKPPHGGWLNNTVGVASRENHTSSSGTMRPKRESGQNQPTASPTLPRVRD